MSVTWVWSLGWEHPLEKGMATHSSILAWRIPWREEPGRLQSMGSQRVMHDWATFTSLFRSTAHWKKKFFFFSSMSHLYILDDNPLSFASFTNIFSHSIGFCILLVFPFGLPKPLNLIRSHLFIFAFISFALGDWSKKILVQFMVKNVFSWFSCRSCMVSFFIFGLPRWR